MNILYSFCNELLIDELQLTIYRDACAKNWLCQTKVSSISMSLVLQQCLDIQVTRQHSCMTENMKITHSSNNVVLILEPAKKRDSYYNLLRHVTLVHHRYQEFKNCSQCCRVLSPASLTPHSLPIHTSAQNL